MAARLQQNQSRQPVAAGASTQAAVAREPATTPQAAATHPAAPAPALFTQSSTKSAAESAQEAAEAQVRYSHFAGGVFVCLTGYW